MSAEGAADAVPEGRVSTGTPGLDAMLEGGLVGRRPYLVVGPSGTGKTTLALQFLIDGVRRGERVLLVTMEEPPNEMRVNHRLLGTELLKVEVFDAIPDIMRYERVPFKDIASVRQAVAFGNIPLEIRRSPELTAVEVTMTALEQMLRSEVQRRTYTRVVIDSLTALQYFCMKGFDPVAGAQAFLRFLSDLHATTILTVESPLEDVDTPERMLSRGEVRLFRWELDGRTVRAIGVEKFRGSSHDVRLHPYRIGPQGLDVNLEVTISRDTRQIIEFPRPVEAVPTAVSVSRAAEEVITPLDPLAEEVRDLVLVGAEVTPLRTEIEAARRAAADGDIALARGRLSRANALVIGLSDSLADRMKEAVPAEAPVAEAYQRILQRSEAARAGMPPTKLPPPRLLEVQLEWVLSLLPEVPSLPAAPTAPVPEEQEAPPEPEAPAVPEEVAVDTTSPSTPTPAEAVLVSEAVPDLAEAPATALEAAAPLPPLVTEAGAESPAPIEPSVAPPVPSSDLAEPVAPTPEETPESLLPAGPTLVPPEAPGESPPAGLPLEEIAVPEAVISSPSASSSGSEEGRGPEEVGANLSPGEPPPAAPESPEPPLAPTEAVPSTSIPSIGPAPTVAPEIGAIPSAAPEAGPAPTVEALPSPPPREATVPVRPLREWSPPALPTVPRRPGAPPPVEIPAPIPPPTRAKRPVAPARAQERRPPLPTFPAGLPAAPERHHPLETVRESRTVRRPPAPPPPSAPIGPARVVPASIPVPASHPAPAPAVAPGSTGATPAKRKRKPRVASPRKKPSTGPPAVGLPPLGSPAPRRTETPLPAAGPPASAEGTPPRPTPTRPKRRPARKRKAPPVVVAHPAPAPSSEGGSGSSPPPPLPTPPTPPPSDSSSTEEEHS